MHKSSWKKGKNKVRISKSVRVKLIVTASQSIAHLKCQGYADQQAFYKFQGNMFLNMFYAVAWPEVPCQGRRK